MLVIRIQKLKRSCGAWLELGEWDQAAAIFTPRESHFFERSAEAVAHGEKMGRRLNMPVFDIVRGTMLVRQLARKGASNG